MITRLAAKWLMRKFKQFYGMGEVGHQWSKAEAFMWFCQCEAMGYEETRRKLIAGELG